jgi:hypothetical protein
VQVAAPSSTTQSSPAPQDIAVIYIARRGWHVDIGFAAADLKPPLRSVLDEFPGAQYLFFGFGDRRYLLARHRNAPVLLAALWPGRGMILATGLTSPPAAAFGAPHVVALAVTVRQASDAQDYVWHSLAAGDPAAGSDPQAVDKPVKSYAAGPYEGSLFFTAVPKYSALHTCNTWVAEALVAASLPIHSGGVLFAGQLWNRVLQLEKTIGHCAADGESPEGIPHRCAGHRPAAQAVVLGRPTGMRWRNQRPYTVPRAPHHWIYGRAIGG